MAAYGEKHAGDDGDEYGMGGSHPATFHHHMAHHHHTMAMQHHHESAHHLENGRPERAKEYAVSAHKHSRLAHEHSVKAMELTHSVKT